MIGLKKLITLILAASMVLSIAGCGGKPVANESSSVSSSTSTPVSSQTSDSAISSAEDLSKGLTGDITMLDYDSGSPNTWNPHEWQSSTDRYILDYTTLGYYNFIVNKDHTSYEAYPELAAEMPIDVTKEYAGKNGVPADATEGWVKKIILRKDLCWEDGTPINAEDFIYSYKELLNPKMKNFRASDVYDGTLTIVNAREYFYDGTEGYAKVNWEDVGIFATGEYELTMVFSKPATEFYTLYNLGSCPLVNKDLYEKLKEEKGDILKTKYGTSQETYISYGPYKLEKYQQDKQIRMVKNDKWYGWNDEDYKGHPYVYTAIDCSIIPDHATQLQTFLQGKADAVGLSADDMKTYSTSDYLYLTPQSYTTRLSLNTDFETLKARETPGICKTMVTYEEFRKAFSRAINRKDYCAQLTASHVPGFGLINRNYCNSPEDGTIYRDSKYAQEALLKIYGGTDADDITGYNIEEAKKLFQEAYDKALKDGNIKETDKVELEFMTYNSDEIYTKIVTFVEKAFADATVGTSLEGKIKIKQVPDENYYDKAEAGDYEMIFSTVGGASMNPYGMLEWYMNPNGMCTEYGFKAKETDLTLTVDGKEITKTYWDWYDAVNNGEYATASGDIRTEILAGVEAGILGQYRTIPIYYRMTASLLSHRAINEAEEYLPIMGYGNRILTMNDADWSAHITQSNGQLAY